MQAYQFRKCHDKILDFNISHSNFEIYNAVLLAIINILHIRSPVCNEKALYF